MSTSTRRTSMSASISQPDVPYATRYLRDCTSDAKHLESSNLPSGWATSKRGWSTTPISDREGPIVSADGLDISFRYSPHQSIVFANHPVPLRCDLYYYEVQICHAKTQQNTLQTLHLGFLPSLYVPPLPRGMCVCYDLKVGDVIGCGISFLQSTIFIMCNGYLVKQINELPISWTVYPAMQADEGIHIISNFGQNAFRADIQSILYSIRVDMDLASARTCSTLLPNELHVEILRHVDLLKHDEPSGTSISAKYNLDTIKACSAVCMAWHRVFRPFSFTNVQICCRQSTRKLSALPVWFPTHVQALSLSSRIDTDHPWAHSFLVSPAAKMAALQQLTWDPTSRGAAKGEDPLAGCPPRLRSSLPALMRGFGNLDVLKLRGHAFPSFLDVARLVSSLPLLRELYLTEVSWNLPEAVDRPPRWLRRPMRMQYLSIKHDVGSDHLYVRGLELVVALWLFVVPSRSLLESPLDLKSCFALHADDVQPLLCLTECLVHCLEPRFVVAQAWHPYLQLLPDEDTQGGYVLLIHPRWILGPIEYRFTFHRPGPDAIKSFTRHTLTSITLPDKLFSGNDICAYEEIGHPFLRKLSAIIPRLTSWTMLKTCVVEVRTYSAAGTMSGMVDNVALRISEAMPDLRNTGKLRVLRSCLEAERWRQDMQLCVLLVYRL
ncbi:hypothetical protein PHLGIDRAFT_28420 [Phlebiopsis gigantea 11061_1 CR5-6]|uniref:Uncharacterized protein n=1 Tax=Phlebiopsis gigantea (strain 11061_1 CR5-6) TaxID=745531 RepID=A0A0C3PT22_PHLG1|nr:hypothetical protein PHLGIDRAFT_28420 [Phlebiopsis gigantea 11061_1 CR5-6]